MHDIRFIREFPEAFDAALDKRGLPACAQEIISLDSQRRALQTELQALQSRRNEASKQIGALKAKEKTPQTSLRRLLKLKHSHLLKRLRKQNWPRPCKLI